MLVDIEIELSRANMLWFNASEAPEKKMKIELKRAKTFWKNFASPPPILASLGQIIIFFPEENRLFISSIFKVRLFISKKYQPPPPQNQMVVP